MFVCVNVCVCLCVCISQTHIHLHTGIIPGAWPGARVKPGTVISAWQEQELEGTRLEQELLEWE